MKTRLIKIIGSALGAIFLGAIGSGVWSGLLSPLWSTLIVNTVRVFAHFSESLADNIYLTAAKGFHEEHSLTILILGTGIFTGILLATVFILFLLKFDRSEDALVKYAGSKYSFPISFFITLVLMVMC